MNHSVFLRRNVKGETLIWIPDFIQDLLLSLCKQVLPDAYWLSRIRSDVTRPDGVSLQQAVIGDNTASDNQYIQDSVKKRF